MYTQFDPQVLSSDTFNTQIITYPFLSIQGRVRLSILSSHPKFFRV